jgi:hypothetical protein
MLVILHVIVVFLLKIAFRIGIIISNDAPQCPLGSSGYQPLSLIVKNHIFQNILLFACDWFIYGLKSGLIPVGKIIKNKSIIKSNIMLANTNL